MNISGIFDLMPYAHYTRAARTPGASSSFGGMLSAESASASETVPSRGFVRYPYNGTNIFEMDYEDDLGRTQSIRIQYAAESMEDDPVVVIYGTSFSGSYSETVRLRDIDLEYAAYPELCALLAHENALKMEENGGIGIPVGTEDNAAHAAALANGELTLEDLMTAAGHGDFSEKRNFLAEYAEQFSLDCLTLDIRITAGETRTVTYGDGLTPEQKAEQAEFERLLKAVDYMIEQQKQQAEQAREQAEKEAMERLLEEKEYQRDLLLERADEKERLEELS